MSGPAASPERLRFGWEWHPANSWSAAHADASSTGTSAATAITPGLRNVGRARAGRGDVHLIRTLKRAGVPIEGGQTRTILNSRTCAPSGTCETRSDWHRLLQDRRPPKLCSPGQPANLSAGHRRYWRLRSRPRHSARAARGPIANRGYTDSFAAPPARPRTTCGVALESGAATFMWSDGRLRPYPRPGRNRFEERLLRRRPPGASNPSLERGVEVTHIADANGQSIARVPGGDHRANPLTRQRGCLLARSPGRLRGLKNLHKALKYFRNAKFSGGNFTTRTYPKDKATNDTIQITPKS